MISLGDASAIPSSKRVSYISHFIDVYCHLLASFISDVDTAKVMRQFTDACEQPFHVHSGGVTQTSKESTRESNKDDATMQDVSFGANVSLTQQQKIIKERLAQAQEQVLFWFRDALITISPGTPPGYVAYHIRRIFFLGDVNTQSVLNADETNFIASASYDAVARFYFILPTIFPAIFQLQQTRPDFSSGGLSFPMLSSMLLSSLCECVWTSWS